MDWSQICNDKLLQDLPYKIELNEWGNIVMSPASNRHGNIQTKVAFFMMSWMEHGTVLTECSVSTSKGVKVADVAWASDGFLKRNKGQTPYLEALDVCVEIKSPSNSDEEMMEKKDLYFAKGAKEFWLCDEDGNVIFYNYRGRMSTSELFPRMFSTIEVDA
jgi:Uma2 family endonuclease